jgi:hypothetical protein
VPRMRRPDSQFLRQVPCLRLLALRRRSQQTETWRIDAKLDQSNRPRAPDHFSAQRAGHPKDFIITKIPFGPAESSIELPPFSNSGSQELPPRTGPEKVAANGLIRTDRPGQRCWAASVPASRVVMAKSWAKLAEFVFAWATPVVAVAAIVAVAFGAKVLAACRSASWAALGSATVVAYPFHAADSLDSAFVRSC